MTTAAEKQLEGEIRDLTKYLDGLPPVLRATGAFDAYEARLTQLRQELARLSAQQAPPTAATRPAG